MALFEKLPGPKSKYDKGIPYTSEAWLQIIAGGEAIPAELRIFNSM